MDKKGSTKERIKRQCNQWTLGSYAILHKGKGNITKNTKGSKTSDPKAQTKVVKHLEGESRKLKQQIEEMTQSAPDTRHEAKHLEEQNWKQKWLQDKTHLIPDKRHEEKEIKLKTLKLKSMS